MALVLLSDDEHGFRDRRELYEYSKVVTPQYEYCLYTTRTLRGRLSVILTSKIANFEPPTHPPLLRLMLIELYGSSLLY